MPSTTNAWRSAKRPSRASQRLGGEALEPTHTATTVRVRNGKIMTTDGPFAETKEQLAGFYAIEAKDLDEAIAFAAKIPPARLRHHRDPAPAHARRRRQQPLKRRRAPATEYDVRSRRTAELIVGGRAL